MKTEVFRDVSGLASGVFTHTMTNGRRAPARTFSMHGGAGALLSVGLLRAVDYASFAACVEGAYLEGGDSFITLCLWEVRACLYWLRASYSLVQLLITSTQPGHP